jgi:membrane associated rhomboid family serine protease
MLPIKDENPTRTFPLITLSIITTNIIVYIYQIGLGPQEVRFIHEWGLVPVRLLGKGYSPRPSHPELFNVFSSMFMHGGVMHLFGNMLYLWIFGNNVEDMMGHLRFLLFYLISGLVAAMVHILVAPNSRIPLVGASGAISGVLGAYFVLFPAARIYTLVFFFYFIRVIRIPALFFIGIWILSQVANSVITLGYGEGGGVAWFAHIGGFIAGVLLVRRFVRYRWRWR